MCARPDRGAGCRPVHPGRRSLGHCCLGCRRLASPRTLERPTSVSLRATSQAVVRVEGRRGGGAGTGVAAGGRRGGLAAGPDALVGRVAFDELWMGRPTGGRVGEGWCAKVAGRRR
jgi:hypothetical protein